MKEHTTDKQKEEIMKRLLVVWKCHPHMRLLQLISNVMVEEQIALNDQFYVDDDSFVKMVEKYEK
jgi:hypothetical protein